MAVTILISGCISIESLQNKKDGNNTNARSTGMGSLTTVKEEPKCRTVSYYALSPKAISVPYTEQVPKEVQIPYQEQECTNVQYTDKVCENKKLSYTYKFNNQMRTCSKSHEVCKNAIIICLEWETICDEYSYYCSIAINNNDTVDGTWKIEWYIPNESDSKNPIPLNSLNTNFTSATKEENWVIEAGKSSTPSLAFKTNISDVSNVTATHCSGRFFEPTKKVCVDVQKTRQDCRMVTKYKTETQYDTVTKYKNETIYERVEKTRRVCENQPDTLCDTLNCNDNQECTADSCTENGCQNIGTCTKQIAQVSCDYSNCGSKGKSECVGTTKKTYTYNCINNSCQLSTSEQTNSAECGYITSSPTQTTTQSTQQPSQQSIPSTSTEKSDSDKLKEIFEKFTEFKNLKDGASIDLTVWCCDSYLIKRANGKTSVASSSQEGDLSLMVDSGTINKLYSSTNICQKLNELIQSRTISEVIMNSDSLTLFSKNFCALKNCIPSSTVPEIKNC